MKTQTRFALFVVVGALAACGEGAVDEVSEELKTVVTPVGLGSSYGIVRYKKIDASSGIVTSVATVPGLSGLTLNAVALNRATHRLYQIGVYNGQHSIATIDSITGALLSAAPTNPMPIDLNAQGQLVGTCFQNSTAKFCRLDPQTGAITVLNPNLGPVVFQGSRTVDTVANRYYTVVTVNGQYKLLSINAATGQIVQTAALQTNVLGLSVTAQQTLVGLRVVNSTLQFVSVGTLGQITTLSTLAGLTWYMPESAAIHASANRYYAIASDNWGARHIVTINSTTGALMDAAPIAASEDIINVRLGM